MRFVDLFAGLGGFCVALRNLGCECVFVSEIDDELRSLYARNFPDLAPVVYGDIRGCKDRVPPHDILCAGFPCQPFSKSGARQGIEDKTRGTLFHEIIEVLRKHRPEYVILENVGNFERHDNGQTWRIVREGLLELGYDVKGTDHITSGGPGLISPHHLGYPHSRERFFIVGRYGSLPENPFPRVDRLASTNLLSVVQSPSELAEGESAESALTKTQRECIDHWNSFLSYLPEGQVELPSFPIWGDEIDASYPYEEITPYHAPLSELVKSLNGSVVSGGYTRDDILMALPSYARRQDTVFPAWKIRFIKQNRDWFSQIRDRIPSEWVKRLRQFPPSLRKLEWNCKGEKRDLWEHVLQFRPSGLRVKRYNSIPALVAMTTTQIPILGPEQRFITRVEGLRLQGLPDRHLLPDSREAAFRALGNAVHVGVAESIASRLLSPSIASRSSAYCEADRWARSVKPERHSNAVEGRGNTLQVR